MGRTNYSLNEMLNSVTKRAFNRYTSQTVDYQHLEAATTTTGLVSNRREYSSASILADTFSLNAQNIVESNYDPFLKVNVNSVITSKTNDIHDVGLSSCTDDGRFLAVTETNTDNVRVYEFDNSLVDKKLFSSSGTINTIEMMDVDMNGDGSETFVAKKVGTQVVVDKFDQDLNSVSSTTLLTTAYPLIEASISVSENGVRVAVTATSNHPFSSLPFRHLFLQVHDNLNTNEYYSLYSYYEVLNTPSVLMSRNGRIVVVNNGGIVTTFEIPSASPGGVVSLSGSGHTQNMGIDKFDLSYDGKVMLTHSGSNASIYIWNGLEWKQFGQTISTGLSGNIVSVAISEYARYFVVASSDQIKVYKLNSVYEQYGTIINGDFGSSGHKIRISKTGDTVVIGNSQMASSYGRAYMYTLKNETTWLLVDQINGSVDTNNSYVLDYVNVYNPYYDGNHGIKYTHNGGHWTNNNGLFFQTNAPFIRLTDNTEYYTNSGIRIPVTFGSKWSVNFKWHLDNNHVSDGSSMSFIFFAPNAPTSTSESQHGGYRVLHNFKGGSETHKIKNPSGNSLTNNSVSYGHSGSAGQAFPPWGASEYKTVTVSYDNGVLFTRVTNTPDSFLNNGYYTTFTGSDLEAQRALWGTQTYIAFGGNTGGWYGDNTGDGATAGYTSFQYIKDFYITQQSTPDNLGKYVRLSNNGDKILIGLQNQLLFKTSSLVNIAAGWEQKGGTITSIDTLSLSLSNDGNYLVIGVSDSVKIFNFSQGSWSQYREIIANDLQFMDFGKYVSITMSGSKVAVGSDKNSIVRVYEPHNVDTTVIEPVKNVVDTISLTPQTSLLEMSGDGNRLFLNADTTVSSTILQSLTIVSTPSGNKYSLDGVTQPTLYLKKGVTFTGIASTFREGGSHPLRISATPDGTHGGDSTVIAEVNTSGNLLIPTSAPNMLYYFCGQHPNMGGVVKIIQGLSIWDKNNAGVWGVRDGLTEGDVIQLSNNGDYLSVNYSNIARLYGIDSDGVVSKIGNDIAATTVTSGAGVFRTFTPTHINTGVSDSGSLFLASYQDSSRAVEICSLTWNPAPSNFFSLSTQSSEITGFSTLSQAKYGIVLSRNGQTLVVYDDLKFSVYTYDGTQWTFIRTKITVTCHDVAISYDGTLLAYKGDKETDLHNVYTTHLFIESAVSGSSSIESSIAEIDVDPTTFAFKSNTTLAVCIPNQDIQLYVHPSWVLSNEITPGYSSPFIEAHAKWSGDGTRLAVGDANAERVSFYEYDNSLVSVTTFIQSGSTISGPTEQVVSGNGNVRVVGHPQYNSYTGYVEIYEKDGNGDWPSTANATFNGPSPTENFGSSIGISEIGTRVVIGSGSKMIVVEKSGGTWSQLGSDISGSATKVAISGDGTKVFNSHSTNLYSYELSSGNWVTYRPTLTTDGSIVKVDSTSSGDEIALSKNNSNKVYEQSLVQQQLGADIDGEAQYDHSGTSVSLSSDGSRVAIGAPYNDENGSSSGHVRVYDWSGSSWTQVGSDIDGEAGGDHSGFSVSLSADGSRVAIGAPSKDSNSGQVTVYELNGSAWVQMGSVFSGSANNERLGMSVSLNSDGTKLAFGATGYYYSSGNATVYSWSGTSWTIMGLHMVGAMGDEFGTSVSLSSDGTRVAIGAAASWTRGYVKVFEYSGSSWTQMGNGYNDMPGEGSTDRMGFSVSLSSDGTRFAHGAIGNTANSGHVRIFEYSGSSWTQMGSDIDSESSADNFGYSVSLSSDGTRVAAGAIFNNNDRGHTRVFDWSGSSWTQVGSDIDGEAGNDESGFSVSLSSDGSRVAIGAPYNGGNDSGHVRVYNTDPEILYSLQSTNSGPMIDISNDGNTTLTINSGVGTFDLAALSGDATKAIIWDGVNLKQYHYTSGAWIKVYELDIDYTPTTLSINTDGSIVGVASSSDVRFYIFGPVQVANGWTLHSFIAGGGNTLENFGSVVDLSNDGNTVLVGAPGDGTSSYKGYVKVYDYVSSAWTLRHTITASGTSDVNFGKSVSLSSDGNRIGYVFDQETQVTNNTTESIVINSSYSSGVSTNNGGSWGNLISLDSTSIKLTDSSNHPVMSDNGVWFPVTFGSEWSIAFDWWVDNNSSSDGDEMRVVFYAPNQPSSSNGSQHGGYYVYHFFGRMTESQQIKTPTDAGIVSRSVDYGSSTNSYGFSLGFNKRVTISYNNGVLFTRVTGTSTADLNNGYSYTFTGSHLNAQQALWGTQTYMAITGRTENQASSQYIRNIDISWDGLTTTTTTYSQASIRDNVDGTLVNPVDSNSDLVNFSEERELSGISMSYDGNQYGVRATSGSYDAVVKVGQPIVNGWTKRGDIMSFSFPNDPSFASNSRRDMSVSSDGNTIAFGWILSHIRVRVYGFSNGAWSRLNLSGGYDIYPGSSGNPTAISVDLSSDGMTLATLSSYSDHVAEAKTYSYSSGGWVQLGSTINFVETGSNTIKISGDGTTLALGNHAPDSAINSVRVYRMGSTDWEIVSPPMHLSAMNPSNFFGAGLNLTNDGSTLTTFNNSGVEFSNFTTQSVVRPSQYLNDITVSGATIDMGGIRFSDSGDRLFVMSGDRRVRVYDSNHNIEIDHGWAGLDTFSSTKDGNSMVLCGEYGYTKVFNRSNGTWSLLLGTPFNTNVTDPVVDIKSGGSTLVFVAPAYDLRVYGYENGSWSQVTTSSGTRGTSVAITDTDMIVVDNKTFQIEDQFQDNSFSAPTLSLNGDSYIRLDFGSPYIERGATITTTASITPGVVISGEVFNEEPGIYTIKYEAEDLLRKKAVPIFRTVEVLPKLPIIKLNGDRVIHHTLGTQLIDPGVTTSIPVNVYHRFANQTTVVAGFPNFLTETTVGEYKIFYTNDTVDKYLRTSSMVSRTIHLRARPVLNLVGGSTVYNPLGETYIDPGVTVSGDAVVSFKKPNVNLSQIQTIKYTAKDEFGIEAVPITRQVIVSERPTITTSGTLFRILNDPISIPTPTVKPVELTSSLNSSNNININQSGTYTITYNVSDSNNIPANQERQSYEVGSYGELSVTKTGYLSNLSKNGRNLAVFNTDIQTYGKELDGSWSNNGFITTPNGSVVTSMKFTSNGSHLVFGMASHLTIGLVRVYKRNTSFVNGWEQVGLDLFGVDYQGKFGHAVDINNDATRIIVSAPEANTNSGTILKAGSLKIYDLQENFWIQQTQIIEGLGAFELLGTSISMSTDGNIIAIGSPGHANTTVSENSVTSVNVGKTTVYSYTDNAWGHVGNVIEDGTIEKRNGFSISLSNDGTTIAVGSENGGGVRIYRFRSKSWIPFGTHISGTFGKSVALSGNTVVIGSEAENNGRVYIYTYGGDDWSLLGDTFEKVIVAEGGTNDMGKFVTISDDRTLLSVVPQSDIRVYSI